MPTTTTHRTRATQAVLIGDRPVGPGHPAYIIGEIGINHNGDLDIARRLIAAAAEAGCDAVKFQKRTPELCVPPEQRGILRETPWGVMTYMDYRHRVEFGAAEYARIDAWCRELGLHWFASPWDTEALAFLEEFRPVCHKLSSASLTDHDLLDAAARTGRPVLLSTGASTLAQIDAAVERLDRDQLVLLHTNSSYPAKNEDLHLRVMETLRSRYGVPVGYSGHETGLAPTVAAVALGACVVERHITLDRAMWGSDQAASVEPGGLARLVRDIRVVEAALGTPEKRVHEAEIKVMAKLRRVKN